MSILSEIIRIQENLDKAYDQISEMGGPPAPYHNSGGLAEAIAAIPIGGSEGGDFYDVTITNAAVSANPQQMIANTIAVFYESESGYKSASIRPNNASSTIRARGVVVIKVGASQQQGPPAGEDQFRLIGADIAVTAIYVDHDGSYTYEPS